MRTALTLLAAMASGCLAQSSSVISLSNGVQLRITRSGGEKALTSQLDPASGNSFYRIYRDDTGLAVFAYQLAVERTPDGDQFRVTARPAGEDFASRFPNADLGKPVPT